LDNSKFFAGRYAEIQQAAAFVIGANDALHSIPFIVTRIQQTHSYSSGVQIKIENEFQFFQQAKNTFKADRCQ